MTLATYTGDILPNETSLHQLLNRWHEAARQVHDTDGLHALIRKATAVRARVRDVDAVDWYIGKLQELRDAVPVEAAIAADDELSEP